MFVKCISNEGYKGIVEIGKVYRVVTKSKDFVILKLCDREYALPISLFSRVDKCNNIVEDKSVFADCIDNEGLEDHITLTRYYRVLSC